MLCALWRPVPGCRGCVFCSHVPDVAAWVLKNAATAPLRGRPTPFRPREGGGLLLRSLRRSRMTSEYRPPANGFTTEATEPACLQRRNGESIFMSLRESEPGFTGSTSFADHP